MVLLIRGIQAQTNKRIQCRRRMSFTIGMNEVKSAVYDGNKSIHGV